VGPDETSSFHCSLLLPLLSLFVFLLLVWSGLSLIIRVIYLLGELDAKLALFDPRGFRLELHG
jgi:hypothetical protein